MTAPHKAAKAGGVAEAGRRLDGGADPGARERRSDGPEEGRAEILALLRGEEGKA